MLGEFYWRVECGETVYSEDFICPPYMLSVETSGTGESREVNFTLGTYMTPEEVESAFGVTDLPRSWSIGPNQPAMEIKPLFLHWAAVLGVLALLSWLFRSGVITEKADGWLITYAFILASILPLGAAAVRHQNEVKRWSESDYSPYPQGE